MRSIVPEPPSGHGFLCGRARNPIFPFQDSADVVSNSARIYVTALLKPYIEPLLFGVPKDSPEY